MLFQSRQTVLCATRRDVSVAGRSAGPEYAPIAVIRRGRAGHFMRVGRDVRLFQSAGRTITAHRFQSQVTCHLNFHPRLEHVITAQGPFVRNRSLALSCDQAESEPDETAVLTFPARIADSPKLNERGTWISTWSQGSFRHYTGCWTTHAPCLWYRLVCERQITLAVCGTRDR